MKNSAKFILSTGIFAIFSLSAGTLFAATGTDAGTPENPQNPPEISQGMGGSGPSGIKPGAKILEPRFVDVLEKLPIEEQVQRVVSEMLTPADGLAAFEKYGNWQIFYNESNQRNLVFERCPSLEMKVQIIASVAQKTVPAEEFQKLENRALSMHRRKNEPENAHAKKMAEYLPQKFYRQFLRESFGKIVGEFCQKPSRLSAAELLEIYEKCGLEPLWGKLSNNIKHSKIDEKLLEEIRALEKRKSVHQERAKIAEQGALPISFLESRSRLGEKELLAAFEAAGFAVPAFPRDPKDWLKLSRKKIVEISGVKEYAVHFRIFDDHSGENFYSHLVRSFDFHFRNPGEPNKQFFAEIVFAGTPDEAWKSAIYLRRRWGNFYANPQRSASISTAFPSIEDVVKTTKQNAFPQLGDMNLAWTGFGDGNGESGESLIVIIRGTTVVSICGFSRENGESTPISVLDFARKIDALLCADVPENAEDDWPFWEKTSSKSEE